MIGVMLVVSACATTTRQTRKALPKEAAKRSIVVLRPDVELYLLHAGGLNEANAEWTRLANKHIADDLAARFKSANVRLVNLKEESDTDDRQTQLLKLHGVLGKAILVHQFNDRPLTLPTKAEKFDWSMGPEAQYLKKKHNANYALFIYVRDSYSSAGRVAAMIFAAALGVGIQGGIQVGFSSLVDLDTGEVVWFNRLARGTGDLRTAAGAKETMNVLLEKLPQ